MGHGAARLVFWVTDDLVVLLLYFFIIKDARLRSRNMFCPSLGPSWRRETPPAGTGSTGHPVIHTRTRVYHEEKRHNDSTTRASTITWTRCRRRMPHPQRPSRPRKRSETAGLRLSGTSTARGRRTMRGWRFNTTRARTHAHARTGLKCMRSRRGGVWWSGPVGRGWAGRRSS
jgi:hypothetical protein